MVPGIKMTLRGREFVVAPLDLDAVERFTSEGTFAKLREFGEDGMPTLAQIAASRAIVFAALAPNHPDLKPEEVGRYLDMGNIAAAVRAVTGATKLEESKPGEQ